MPDLNYKITTSAELAGAQATADALERQIGQAKALKQDYSELQKKHDLVTQSIKDAKVPQDNNNEQLRHGGEHARGLHGALHLIARESGPAMGAAVGAAAALMTGGLYMAVFAVRELLSWFAEAKQKAEDFRERQASLWFAVKDGANKASDAAREFAEKLDDEADKSENVKNKFAEQKTLLNEQLKAHQEILDAIEKEELAAANGDKDKEDKIKARFAALKNTNTLEGERQRIALEKTQLGTVTSDKQGTDFAAAGLEKAREFLIAQGAELKARLDNIVKEFGSPEKIKTASDTANWLDWGGMAGYEKKKKTWADYQAISAAVDQNAALQKATEHSLGTAQSSSSSDASQISMLTASISELVAELKIHTTTQQSVELLGRRGGESNESLGQLATETGKSHAQTEKIVSEIIAGHLKFQTVMAQMEAQLKAITARQQSQLTQ